MSKIKKIKNVFATLMTISLAALMVGAILTVWTGFFGLKIVLTSLIILIFSAFFHNTAKEMEGEESHDN